MPAAIRLILGDQLGRDIPTLENVDKSSDTIVLAEVASEADYVPHHKQKIAFIFSAMRHFADDLKEDGYQVRYYKLGESQDISSLFDAVKDSLNEIDADQVIVTEAGEFRLREDMDHWQRRLNCPVEILKDTRFLADADGFAKWASERKAVVMDQFYRLMRKKTGLLMDADGKPEGGQWNYDADNRKKLPKGIRLPGKKAFKPDAMTTEVLELVGQHFPDNPGTLDTFDYAVTRADALIALDDFIKTRIENFGDYQDALKEGEATLFHSRLSAYINVGLLGPMEVCKAAEKAYQDGHAPLNAVEGFIRQIIGWREYVRGIYLWQGPDYGATNHLDATTPLPDFFWTGKTDMACVADVVNTTMKEAYAHHIQRLMVTGVYALIAGINPQEVQRWYLAVYADAYEWVEQPNTHGMALYADGGIMATKPYAASGNYINRMSDHCKGCRYNVKARTGDDACPFNALYWDFLARHRDRLSDNHRMGLVFKNLDRIAQEDLKAIRETAAKYLENLS